MDEDSYRQLLKKAMQELPETITSTDRFKIEGVRGHLEGNKTIISNLRKIAKDVNRDADHLLKFLLKELATPGKWDGDRTILGAKIPASKINRKVRQYAGEYVLCSSCGKPDTRLAKKDGATYLHCTACGEEHVVKGG